MKVQRSIEAKVAEALAPAHLDVINESHMHSVPPGSESHFKLVIVSDRFDGLSRVKRHQTVNGILAKELSEDIHALSMETLTAEEWERRGHTTFDSPACLGGGKADAR
jgi:BolA protein